MITENGVCVIVQARLSSKRLPRKALIKLDHRVLLEHVLSSLKKVNAQCFVLACDYSSYESFKPFAEREDFLIVQGSESDVLSRYNAALNSAQIFCHEKNLPSITCVVRATADNPFLFIDAINDSVARYFELQQPDYFTFTGLPHGSGVELIKPEALIAANKVSNSEYEREHVGPAIYYHKDKFRVVYETAVSKYYFPDMITTVDTQEDLSRTKIALEFLHEKEICLPATYNQIIEATKYATDIILFVPSVKTGNGSGHLRRAIELAIELEKKFRTQIFIDTENIPSFAEKLLLEVNPKLITNKLPKKAKLIVLDNFRTTADEANVFELIAPVLALDEGGSARNTVDYLLDIIPRLKSNDYIIANTESAEFIPLPKNRKPKTQKINFKNNRLKVLITCGGEDNNHLAIPIGKNLLPFNFDITAVSSETSFSAIQKLGGKLKLLYTIPNLREQLFNYDVVITIYGFTAFEALAAGCLVVLVSPTDYHYQLGIQNDFTCFPVGVPDTLMFSEAFTHGIKIPKCITPKTVQKDLSKYIVAISQSQHCSCPICDNEYINDEHKVVHRLPDRTIAQCKKTGLYFLSFIMSDGKKYNENYFFDEYKKQYGKTYLEDFPNIMKQGIQRLKIIEECYQEYLQADESFFNKKKNLLDVGCAYGAFLKACEQTDWFSVGTDISNEAITYVADKLKFPAFCSAFPAIPEQFSYIRKKSFAEDTNIDFENAIFNLQPESFQAVTMWFVIEHFKHLDAVLKQVHSLLVDGGIFAFSTPTLSGVSGKKSNRDFFANSPTDHYSIFDVESVEKVLELYGFKLVRIVSIGHHPERFKNFAHIKRGSLIYKILNHISKRKKLGDSMEVYAVKRISV